MLVVGLTGGIGTGKTVASNEFARLGISVVDADIASRQVVQPGSPALRAIAAHFGGSVLQADGQLNRAALRRWIFDDSGERQWLERLLHPLIREELVQQLAASRSPYALLVSPLLLEKGQHELTNRILVIDAPEDQQRQRASARDGVPPADIDSIIKTQMSRADRRSRADDVIENSDNLDSFLHQVRRLHLQYLDMAASLSKG